VGSILFSHRLDGACSRYTGMRCQDFWRVALGGVSGMGSVLFSIVEDGVLAECLLRKTEENIAINPPSPS
jgi:hypothetical protein